MYKIINIVIIRYLNYPLSLRLSRLRWTVISSVFSSARCLWGCESNLLTTLFFPLWPVLQVLIVRIFPTRIFTNTSLCSSIYDRKSVPRGPWKGNAGKINSIIKCMGDSLHDVSSCKDIQRLDNLRTASPFSPKYGSYYQINTSHFEWNNQHSRVV